MATEQELIKLSAENYRRSLDIIQARREEKPDKPKGDKEALEEKRLLVEQENCDLAEQRAAAIRPTFKAPSDKLGVMAVSEASSKVPWDASKASQGFRLIKGNAKIVMGEDGQPKLVVGKSAVTSKGAPKNDCAHVYWCSDTWELGEQRNLPVAKAFQVAREWVGKGGIAWVESRTLQHKGDNPSTNKHVIVTDHKGFAIPLTDRGRFNRGRKTSESSADILWTIVYDDGTILNVPRELPTTDEQMKAQAKDLLLYGAFQSKTPMVCSFDGNSYKRSELLKELPNEPMPEYKRPSPQAMKVNKNNGKWVSKAQQTRVTFSAG